MQAIPSYQSKRSQLFVGLSGGAMNLCLVDSDFEAGTFFTETLQVKLPRAFELSMLDAFLEEVIPTWGAELGRRIIDCTIGICVPASAGGQVDGATLVVSPEYYKVKYRSNLLQVSPICFSGEIQLEAVARAARGLEASSLVMVNLDWDEIAVFNAAVGEGGNVHVGEFRVQPKRLKELELSLLKNVLAVKPDLAGFRDFAQNLTDFRPIRSRSAVVWDFIRGYVMSNLMHIQDQSFRTFGIKGENPFLVISGNLCGLLPPEYLLLAVVDGLQLRGRYRVAIDVSGMSMFGLVINPEALVFPVSRIYPARYIYVSPERGATGRPGKNAFLGAVVSQGKEVDKRDLILGLAGQIYTYDLPGSGRFLLKPERDVFFPNLRREEEFLAGAYEEMDEKLIVDCREIPVVYGPSYERNATRLSGWLRGLNLGVS